MNGINVTTQVAVDWAELGDEFAGLTSDDQKRFFLAFADRLNMFQSPYIVDDITKEIADDLEGYGNAQLALLSLSHQLIESLEKL